MRDRVWTEEQEAAVFDFILGKASWKDCLRILHLDEHKAAEDVRQQLAASLQDKNSDRVEAALGLAFALQIPAQVLSDLLRSLLIQNWHHKHEDILGLLEEEADPRSLVFITSAIKAKPNLEYLTYDDYGSFYKKCLWALQAIGTSEALEVVRECSTSEDPVLRQQALHRLEKLDASS